MNIEKSIKADNILGGEGYGQLFCPIFKRLSIMLHNFTI